MSVWPEDYVSALIVGVDDVHPETSKDGCDCGGDLTNGALGLLVEILESHPRLKINLFVTPDWMFKPQSKVFRYLQRHCKRQGFLDKFLGRLFLRTWPKNRFKINKDEFREWVSFVRHYVTEGRVRVGIHGLYHFQPYIRHAAEFLYLSYAECRKRLKIAEEIFKNTKIPIEKGFAPPGWGVTDDLINALEAEDFIYIAGDADFKTNVDHRSLSENAGLQGVQLFFPTLIKGRLVNVPRNWDIGFSPLERARAICRIGGLISVHSHIEDSYHGDHLGNGITVGNIERLSRLLQEMEEKYPGKIWYTSFGEVAEYWRKVRA